MRKVLVTSNSFGKYDQEPIKKLEAAGFEVVRNPYGRMMEEDEFIEQMQGSRNRYFEHREGDQKGHRCVPGSENDFQIWRGPGQYRFGLL